MEDIRRDENEMARKKVPFDRTRIVRDWNTKLINPWNPIESTFEVELEETYDGYRVDKRVKKALEMMMEKMASYDLKPVLISAYRSLELQTRLFEEEVKTLTRAGMPLELAPIEASKMTAKPGTSEHHTGLAVDIVARHNMNLDESQKDTGVAKWLEKYAYKYGFILRYPRGKEEITGIMYEPWHYRYVGEEVALVLYDNNLTLEEYLSCEIV